MSILNQPINIQPSDIQHPDAFLEDQWARIRTKLRRYFGDDVFDSWLKDLALEGTTDKNVIRLSSSNKFIRDHVYIHYLTQIDSYWREENSAIRYVDLVVDAHNHEDNEGLKPFQSSDSISAPKRQNEKEQNEKAKTDDSSASEDKLDSWEVVLDERLTFASFVVGKPNELAYAAARRVAESAGVIYNPLFLYGGVGLGKTHLMRAIAWHIKACHPQRRVLYMSAEKFMYRFIRALRFKDTMAFKEQFRSVDVLMIDDVQFMSGKDSTQEEFFHTFNSLVDLNRQVIISADKSPSDLEGMEERMRSRLGWGLVAEIHPTTYELRLGILQAKVEENQIKVPHKVLELLAAKITSNVRELEGALNRLIAHATLVGRSITVDSTFEVLQDLFRANDRRISVEEIQKRVADHFGVKVAEMYSARRSQALVRPRHIAMYLSKHMTTCSLPEIGRKFGGRDHTTVLHALRQVEQLMVSDNKVKEDIELLNHSLNRLAQY